MIKNIKILTSKPVKRAFILSVVYLIFVSGGPITGLGPWTALMDVVFLALLTYIAISFVIGLVFFFVKGAKETGILNLASSLLLILLFIPIILVGKELRSYGFYVTGLRAEPILSAVEFYKLKNGTVPLSIDELIPEYLEKIPYGVPDFHLYTGENDTWHLSANVSTGLLNFDEFLYASDKNYAAYDSTGEPIGKWLYYHE